MRQIVTAICLFLVVLARTSIGAQNDTLEMELESNITVVKLEHGLKFQAHSEFGLPDKMTDLFNSTAADSEGVRIEIRQTIILRNRNKTGANNSSLPVLLETPRAKRSNKNAAAAQKKTTKKTAKKTTTAKTVATKKKVTTKKKKVTTKKPKTTTKKKLSTKKSTTTTRPTTRHHQFPDQRPPLQPVTEQKPGYPDDRHPTTRRKFVMYDDEEKEAEKKDPEKDDKFNDSNSNWRSWKN